MHLKSIVFAAFLLFLFQSISIGDEFTTVNAEGWPEGEALFRQDNRWLGADGAMSYRLNKNSVLWLFGDTFVAKKPGADRKNAAFVRNTIGIQHGLNPAEAKMKFYWKTAEGYPSSYFSEDGEVWFWPGGVTRVKDRLFIFLMAIRPTKGDVFGFGFEAFETRVILVDNPDDNPSEWNLNEVISLKNDIGVVVGSSSLVIEDDFVYAFGSKEDKNHDIYLVRWNINDFYNADLSTSHWWCGDKVGFASINHNSPQPVIQKGQTEFTVHYCPHTKQYLQAQGIGFGVVPLALRQAETLTGPWTEPIEVFQPEEKGRKELLLYAVKSHPELSGADLVLSYVTNSTNADVVYKDNTVYYPRLVRINFSASSRESEQQRE